MHVLTWGAPAPCVVSLYWWCSSLYDTRDIPHKMLIIPGSDSEVELSESRLKKSTHIGHYSKHSKTNYNKLFV